MERHQSNPVLIKEIEWVRLIRLRDRHRSWTYTHLFPDLQMVPKDAAATNSR